MIIKNHASKIMQLTKDQEKSLKKYNTLPLEKKKYVVSRINSYLKACGKLDNKNYIFAIKTYNSKSSGIITKTDMFTEIVKFAVDNDIQTLEEDSKFQTHERSFYAKHYPQYFSHATRSEYSILG